MILWACDLPFDRSRTDLPDLPAFLSPSPSTRVREDPDSALFRLPAPTGDWMLKVYRHRPWYLALRARMFPSRGRRELAVLEELLRRGIPGLVPIAAGEEDWGPLRTKSFLVTKFWKGSTTLEAWCDQDPSEAERDRVFPKLAKQLRHMHEQGFLHGSLFPRNIGLHLEESPSIRFFDAPFGRFFDGPVPLEKRADDLACLMRFFSPHFFSRHEKGRLFRLYLDRSPGEGWGDEGRALARAILRSPAFTRSLRRRFLHWWAGDWTELTK